MSVLCVFLFFFFQAEDGIRDLVRSRGLGDVYKRQPMGYAGLWMAGSSTDNQLKLAAQLYGSGSDFFPGPLTIDGSATISDQVSLAYDMVLRIDKSQVDQHVLWYNCLNEPSCDIATLFPNGYTVPQAFINWPANGDVNAGQALYLAPYVDATGDGYYDPYAGDYT